MKLCHRQSSPNYGTNGKMEIMRQKHFSIDGKDIKLKIDFYLKLNEILDFENYVEGSAKVPVLDVLWDVMSCGAGLNCVLHWKYSEISKQNLGEEYFYAIVDVLKMAESVNWIGDYIPFKLCLE